MCVLYRDGPDIRRTEREFKTDWVSILAAKSWVLKALATVATPDTLRYCIESTGTYHRPILKAWRGIPSVVNPLLAGPTRRKTDVLDARLLAYHSITGIWKPSFIPTEAAENLRVLWMQRAEALRAATRASNRINNIILRSGHTFGAQAPMRSRASSELIEALLTGEVPDAPGVCPDGLPEAVRPVIQSLYNDMHEAILATKAAAKAAEDYVLSHDWPTGKEPIPGKQLLPLLESVPGVGQATAITWLAEVTDPRRFQAAEQVSAFSGCDPSLKVSAGKVTSHTRRAGNVRLHLALLYAASGILRKPDEPLANWGRSIAGRHKKGGYRKATGAIARRLAVALWYVHSKAEPFSYAGYTFTKPVTVPDVPLHEVLPPPPCKLLKVAGVHTSAALADAYLTGKLAGIRGFGEKAIATVKAWLAQHQRHPKKKDLPGRTYKLSPARLFEPRAKSAVKDAPSVKPPRRARKHNEAKCK